MLKRMSKCLLALSLLLTGVMLTPKDIYANDVETRAVQIQMTADGEVINETFTYNGTTISYDVTLVGTYVVDINNNILSENIGATVVQRPAESIVQAYVRGCSTTISGKIATTTVIIGFKFNKSTVLDYKKQYTFNNSVVK